MAEKSAIKELICGFIWQICVILNTEVVMSYHLPGYASDCFFFKKMVKLAPLLMTSILMIPICMIASAASFIKQLSRSHQKESKPKSV